MIASSRARILLVEDEPIVGELIQTMLEHAGYTILGRAAVGLGGADA